MGCWWCGRKDSGRVDAAVGEFASKLREDLARSEGYKVGRDAGWLSSVAEINDARACAGMAPLREDAQAAQAKMLASMVSVFCDFDPEKHINWEAVGKLAAELKEPHMPAKEKAKCFITTDGEFYVNPIMHSETSAREMATAWAKMYPGHKYEVFKSIGHAQWQAPEVWTEHTD